MKKRIVVYYSYKCHTKYIAEIIRKKLNCDILEIKPKKAYTTDYHVVTRIYQNNETAKKVDEIEDINMDLSVYDEFIIGTPVWWYTIAPTIRAFIKKYDLKDKRIIPFATNVGWLGRTFEEIKELCPNANVENKMNIVFTEEYDECNLITPMEEIDNWINKI